jgi:hypothetical protein
VRPALVLTAALTLSALACTSTSASPTTTTPASTSSAGGAGGASGAGGAPADAGACVSDRGTWDDPPAAAPPDAGSWRTSLAACWTDATCPRAMLVTHGGEWDGDHPYDSRHAFVRAVEDGSDGIKGDLRVTKDGVGVVTHSSPIQGFESLECAGRKIEEMTADEVTCCHLIGSTTQTFQRVSDLLAWAHGRTVVMLDVKLATDLPRAIQIGLESKAEDDLFLEVHYEDYVKYVVGAPGWEKLHYLVWMTDPGKVDELLAAHHPAQAFMVEMDPTSPGFDAAATKDLILKKLHPAGVRAFTSSAKNNPTAADQQALFEGGFDVVMTYDLGTGLEARKAVNAARGVTPP